MPKYSDNMLHLEADETEEVIGPKSMVGGLGNAAGYLARSEGVNSRGTIALAHKAMIDPADLTGEEIRKLAAAILAHEKYGP